VLLKISLSTDHIELARQLVSPAYWRKKELSVDLVIWNQDPVGYRQNLHDQIMGLVRRALKRIPSIGRAALCGQQSRFRQKTASYYTHGSALLSWCNRGMLLNNNRHVWWQVRIIAYGELSGSSSRAE
jgi:hypothetical protein